MLGKMPQFLCIIFSLGNLMEIEFFVLIPIKPRGNYKNLGLCWMFFHFILINLKINVINKLYDQWIPEVEGIILLKSFLTLYIFDCFKLPIKSKIPSSLTLKKFLVTQLNILIIVEILLMKF